MWIEVFRGPGRPRLEKLGDFDELVTCLPVIQEVLQGFRDEAAFRKAAANAKEGCPVSKLLKAEITLNARLEA